MSRNDAPSSPGRLKISVQYRSKNGKVFELSDGANVLAIHISPRVHSDDSGNWHIEIRLGTIGPTLVEEWGDTAADALQRAASVWNAQLPPLTTFNWEAVASELHAVQAV